MIMISCEDGLLNKCAKHLSGTGRGQKIWGQEDPRERNRLPIQRPIGLILADEIHKGNLTKAPLPGRYGFLHGPVESRMTRFVRKTVCR